MTKRLRLAADAYTLDAIVEAGVPPQVARTLLADGPRAVPERPRVSVSRRGRAKELTTRYVWGPDAMALLASRAELEVRRAEVAAS